MSTPEASGTEARRQAVGLAVAIAVAVALAATLQIAGRSARRVLPDHRVVPVRSAADALAAWRAAGVSGRVILWLDRELPVVTVAESAVAAWLRDPDRGETVGEDNFLYLAMRANVVRRVVYAVPDDRWDGYVAAARDRPELHRTGDGFVQFVQGVPVFSAPARVALRSTEERPLVYVSPRTREFFGAAVAEGIAADPGRSDLVLVREEATP